MLRALVRVAGGVGGRGEIPAVQFVELDGVLVVGPRPRDEFVDAVAVEVGHVDPVGTVPKACRLPGRMLFPVVEQCGQAIPSCRFVNAAGVNCHA